MVTATQTNKEQFLQQGYLKVEGVLDPETVLDPIIQEYHGVLDDLANDLFASGRISSRYEDLGFDERLMKIYQEKKTDIGQMI